MKISNFGYEALEYVNENQWIDFFNKLRDKQIITEKDKLLIDYYFENNIISYQVKIIINESSNPYILNSIKENFNYINTTTLMLNKNDLAVDILLEYLSRNKFLINWSYLSCNKNPKVVKFIEDNKIYYKSLILEDNDLNSVYFDNE